MSEYDIRHEKLLAMIAQIKGLQTMIIEITPILVELEERAVGLSLILENEQGE